MGGEPDRARGDRSPGAVKTGGEQRSRPLGTPESGVPSGFPRHQHRMRARMPARTILGSALRFHPGTIEGFRPASLAGLFHQGHWAVVYGWRHQKSAVSLWAWSWEIPKGLRRLTPRTLGRTDRHHREKGPRIMTKVGGRCCRRCYTGEGPFAAKGRPPNEQPPKSSLVRYGSRFRAARGVSRKRKDIGVEVEPPDWARRNPDPRRLGPRIPFGPDGEPRSIGYPHRSGGCSPAPGSIAGRPDPGDSAGSGPGASQHPRGLMTRRDQGSVPPVVSAQASVGESFRDRDGRRLRAATVQSFAFVAAVLGRP